MTATTPHQSAVALLTIFTENADPPTRMTLLDATLSRDLDEFGGDDNAKSLYVVETIFRLATLGAILVRTNAKFQGITPADLLSRFALDCRDLEGG